MELETGLTELTKGQLISRCKAGERQALDLLYQEYKPQLLNICKQYTHRATPRRLCFPTGAS